MARETWVQSQAEAYQRLKKWYLISPCLALSITRYGSRVKWSNPGKGGAPFPTPYCCSYRKGSLQVTLDYGRQLYLQAIPILILIFKKLMQVPKYKKLNCKTLYKFKIKKIAVWKHKRINVYTISHIFWILLHSVSVYPTIVCWIVFFNNYSEST